LAFRDSNKLRVRKKLKEMANASRTGLAVTGDYFIMPRGQALLATKSLLQYTP
jgi:hypothetical protein